MNVWEMPYIPESAPEIFEIEKVRLELENNQAKRIGAMIGSFDHTSPRSQLPRVIAFLRASKTTQIFVNMTAN